MQKSNFKIEKMDCPSEEQLVRMKLQGLEGIQKLVFDLGTRKLEVYHTGDVKPIENTLNELRLGSVLLSSTEGSFEDDGSLSREKKLLITVLAINAFFFVVEMITGVIGNSMGLIADSLDMLADVIVYGLSLYAVGGLISRKKAIARYSSYFQLALAIFGLVEVIRRFMGFGEVPNFMIMIGVASFALVGNLASLILFARSKSKEAHMQASWIFTSNDVLANIGVIIAGGLVYLSSSKLPDLIVGTIVFFLVVRGAYQIYKLGR